MNPTSPEDIKSLQHANWSAISAGWRKHDDLITNGTAPATERMLDVAGIGVGMRLLDLASGTGEPALTAARRVGPDGFVLATDLVEDMLAFAREKAARDSLGHVEFRCCDAETLEVEESSFDALTCRWGIMFMPDPTVALARARAALRPGGRAAVATWSAPEKNPFAALPLSVVQRHANVPAPPPDAPGIFAFADPERLKAVMEQAGFTEITVEEVHVPMMEVDSGAAYWQVMRDLAGPIVALIEQLPPETQTKVAEEIGEAAEALRDGDTVRVSGVSWVAGGTRA